jgi:folate-dependent phosphoribosylglycinamide formyltransferase PurN
LLWHFTQRPNDPEETMPSFLVVTTRDLPEAYFLARFLERRRQRFGILNITGRPPAAALGVLLRLGRRRGWLYLVDLLSARAMAAFQPPAVTRAFADIDAVTIAGLKARHPCHESTDPHAPETLAFVRRLAPDWIVLAGAPVLRPSLLGLARRATLNRHLGLLPEYRGSDCPVWTLAADALDDVGFSVHVVTERVDAGDVVVRRPVPAPPGVTLDEYLALVQRQASDAFVEVLDGIVQGVPLAGRPQTGGGTYYPPAPLSAWRRARRNLARRAARRFPTAPWRADADPEASRPT